MDEVVGYVKYNLVILYVSLQHTPNNINTPTTHSMRNEVLSDFIIQGNPFIDEAPMLSLVILPILILSYYFMYYFQS